MSEKLRELMEHVQRLNLSHAELIRFAREIERRIAHECVDRQCHLCGECDKPKVRS